MPDNDPIEHVIVLMLENRSFDHILGGLAADIPGLNGADAARFNVDDQGNQYHQSPGAAQVLAFDPKHELRHVKKQLSNENSGFVADFAGSFPDAKDSDRAEIMKYHAADTLPATHFLAKNYTVCNRWFSSVPGPTWANRFFVHSGTSLGRVEMPEGLMDANLHWYNQRTIYDRLNEKSVPWRIYYGDIPQSLMLVNQLEPKNASRYRPLNQFAEDLASAKACEFPAYTFIEPAYYDPGACDDHPPHNILEGQALIADVYNSLVRNEALWQKSLLVFLYDEHGGFYDHVVPPSAVAPDHYLDEYKFNQLGVRVPAILISPYAKEGVCDVAFDHTSLLKYLIDRWSLGPLGARTDSANSIALALTKEARQNLPGFAPLPKAGSQSAKIVLPTRRKLNGGQSALVAMSQLLESMTKVGEQSLMSRVKRLVTGADGIIDVAIERVEDFFDQAKESG